MGARAQSTFGKAEFLLAPFRDFAGAGDATFFWPRWLVLRGVGVVYSLIFSGLLVEADRLIGPQGVLPFSSYWQHVRDSTDSTWAAFWSAPSIFWWSGSSGLINPLAWLGLACAVALVFNLWPRGALAGCWLIFLSFVSALNVFSPAQLDDLMLEVALLCIPFAPSGFRPGLGKDSPPAPLVMFMLRWLLFRVMFESGLVKLVAGDPHWRDFTAMEVMYETSPFPTILGYIDHHLPRAYHSFEIILTFAAELAAPLLALFARRPGRWFAFISWSALQIGIQLTNNFGWLNTAALALGLLWLDDQMLATLARKLKLAAWAQALLRGEETDGLKPPRPAWARWALAAGLWMHFYVTWFYFGKAAGWSVYSLPAALTWPVDAVRGLASANEYSLYAKFDAARYQVDFEGSNDGGRTWRLYPYRYLPQRLDRICPFIAPWFPRFEASLQIAAWGERKARVFHVVATHLLAGNPRVVGLFPQNPFADRPPSIIRMISRRLSFTDWGTQRSTGRYWDAEVLGDYLPGVYVGEGGRIAEFSLAPGEAAVKAGDLAGARAYFDQQYRWGSLEAGIRLADMVARGVGGPPEPARAFALFTELVAKGLKSAEHNLGVCHEYGVGVPVNYPEAAIHYRRAAREGNVLSMLALAGLHAANRVQPRDDVDGLAWLFEARARAADDSPLSRHVRAQAGQLEALLTDRLSASDQRKAGEVARERLKASGR